MVTNTPAVPTGPVVPVMPGTATSTSTSGENFDKVNSVINAKLDKITQLYKKNPAEFLFLVLCLILGIFIFVYKRNCIFMAIFKPERYNIPARCFKGWVGKGEGESCARDDSNPCCDGFCMIKPDASQSAIGHAEKAITKIGTTVALGTATAVVSDSPIDTAEAAASAYIIGDAFSELEETTPDVFCAGKGTGSLSYNNMQSLLPEGAKQAIKNPKLKWGIPIGLGLIFAIIYFIITMKLFKIEPGFSLCFQAFILFSTGFYIGTLITSNYMINQRPDIINPNGNHYCFTEGPIPNFADQCNARGQSTISETTQTGGTLELPNGACCPGFIPASYIERMIKIENSPSAISWAKATIGELKESAQELSGLGVADEHCLPVLGMLTVPVSLDKVPPEVKAKFGKKPEPVTIDISGNDYDTQKQKLEKNAQVENSTIHNSFDELKKLYYGIKPIPKVAPGNESTETTERYCYGDGKQKVTLFDSMKGYTGYKDPTTGYLIPTPNNPCCEGNIFYQPAGLKYYMHLMKKGFLGFASGPFLELVIASLFPLITLTVLATEAAIKGDSKIKGKKVSVFDPIQQSKDAFLAAEIDECIPIDQVGHYDVDLKCFKGTLKQQKYGSTAANYPDLDDKADLFYPCCNGMMMVPAEPGSGSEVGTCTNIGPNSSCVPEPDKKTCKSIINPGDAGYTPPSDITGGDYSVYNYDHVNDQYCFKAGTIPEHMSKFATNGKKPKGVPQPNPINPCCKDLMYIEMVAGDQCKDLVEDGKPTFDFRPANMCFYNGATIGVDIPDQYRKCCTTAEAGARGGGSLCKNDFGEDYCQTGGCTALKDLGGTLDAIGGEARDVGHDVANVGKDAGHLAEKGGEAVKNLATRAWSGIKHF